MTIKDKIIMFIEHVGIPKADFYRLIGISPSNFKGQALYSALGSDKIIRILTTYPSLSAEWLLRDEGEMLRSNNQIDEVLDSSLQPIPKTSLPNEGAASHTDSSIALALIANINTKDELLLKQAENLCELRVQNELLKAEIKSLNLALVGHNNFDEKENLDPLLQNDELREIV